MKFSKYPATGLVFLGEKFGYQHFEHFAFPANYNGPKLALPIIRISALEALNHSFGINPEKKSGTEPTQ